MTRNLSKYYSGTIASVVIASSVMVPVASAEFKDEANISSWAKAGVDYVINKKIMLGSDGNFNPKGNVTRAELAQIIQNIKGIVATRDVAFADVEKDAWYYEAVTAVASAGYVDGDGKGNFDPKGKVTREQAAKIIISAFPEFEAQSDISAYPDIDNVSPWAVPFLEKAVANKVISGKQVGTEINLEPKSYITREDIAVIFQRTLQKVEEIESLKVKIASYEVLDKYSFIVKFTDGATETYKVEKPLVLGDNLLLIKHGGEEFSISVHYYVEPLVINSVKAIDKKTVTLSFSKELEKIEEVIFNDSVTNVNQYIKQVTISSDKKSASVEFYNALTSGSTYNIDVKSGDDKAVSKLDFEIGEPDNIILEDQSVANGENLVYKVVDENGLDITADVKVEIESDKAEKFVASIGAVKSNLVDGDGTVKVKLVVKKDGKTIASSKRVEVNAKSAPKIAGFGEVWTVGLANFDATDFKAETTLAMNATNKSLAVTFIDQYGDKAFALANDQQLQFESLNTEIAIIDRNTGVITPRMEGKASIKVNLIEGEKIIATKTVLIDITAAAVFTTLEADKETVTATVGGKFEKVTFKSLDQFGNAIEVKDDFDVIIADEKVARATMYNNELSVVALGEGTTTITVMNGSVVKTIIVSAQEVGAIVGYTVVGFLPELNTRDDLTTKNNDTMMSLEVYGVDQKGTLNITSEAFEYTVKNQAGAVIYNKTSTNKRADISVYDNEKNVVFETGKQYTLEVKVGTLIVATHTFTVKENGIAPTVKQKGDQLTVTANTAITDVIAKLFDFSTVQNTKTSIVATEFISDNAEVIQTNGTQFSKTDGLANIYVSSITVNVQPVDEKTVEKLYTGTYKIPTNHKIIILNDNYGPKVSSVVVDPADDEILLVTLNEQAYYKNGDNLSLLDTGNSAGKNYAKAFVLTAAGGTEVANAVKSAELRSDRKTFEVEFASIQEGTYTLSFKQFPTPVMDVNGHVFNTTDTYTITIDSKGRIKSVMKK